MPYERHGDLRQPAKENCRIWRFMDLAKFLSLLSTSSLYFARGDRFEDPYEGMLSERYATRLRAGRRVGERIGTFDEVVELCRRFRREFYVSSWHVSEREPANMWKLYSAVEGGIAVCSTYKRLKQALRGSPHRVFSGLVDYDDRRTFGSFNSFKFVMSKRASFEHEREARFLVWRPGTDQDGTPRPELDGIDARINLDRVLTAAVISPASPQWLIPALRDVRDRFGFQFDVRRSDLYEVGYLKPSETPPPPPPNHSGR